MVFCEELINNEEANKSNPHCSSLNASGPGQDDGSSVSEFNVDILFFSLKLYLLVNNGF